MRITICGSVNFAEEMKRIKRELENGGHEVVLPWSICEFGLNSHEDADRLKERQDYIDGIKQDATIRHFDEIKNCDAVLIVNMEKGGIKNYIGGATLAEIMFAFYFKKKIFFLNPIPTDKRLMFFLDELSAVRPVILNGDMNLIK
jgi:hypothetical protein